MNRVLVWFSCGAASAVAAKMAVDKYEDIFDVFEKTGWLIGVGGARCTTELKKNVRKQYQREGDLHIFGLTSDEQARIDRFEDQNNDIDVEWILANNDINKNKCYRIIQQAGIDLPEMYKLGYNNNNCIGCVKGQAGYWNKIRVDFPEAFDRMALLERKMNVAINKTYKTIDGKKKRFRVFLDELDPSAGRDVPMPDIDCGALCVTPEEKPELVSRYDDIVD